MHARAGLETEYMSDEWFDSIKICIDEAKKFGMEAWAYDENGWPSGFADGELFDDGFELLSYLHEGENELLLKICFSNRNLQGPHHGQSLSQFS